MSQPPLRPEPAPPLPTQQPQPPQPPLSRSYAACPFPPRPDINAIFGLARGALDPHIDVDAIVVPNNEAFTMRTGATGEVFLAAGPSLSRAISIIGDCPTGDCRVTPGFELPCRHIIHAAAPRFQAKFANAAHSALHSCYRSALQLAVVKHARTVGIGQMHSATRGYPTEEAPHIVLRTVRRFLEKNATAIDTLLLFCDDASDFAIYHKLATLYFPRTEAEAAASAVGLADVELGDEHGEISSEERRIRIGNGPLREENAGAAALSDAKLPFWANGNSPSRRPELSAGFMAVAPTPEELREQRRKSLAATRPPVKAAPLPPQQPQVEDDSTEGDAVRLYEKLLLIAPSSPLSEAEKFVYISGRDKHGRSTAVIIGSRLHARCRTDRERDSVWLRLLHETEELVRKPFSVAFIATGMPSDSGPTFDFLRDYFMTLPWHVQSNLGSFYLMHPSWKMRIAFFLLGVSLWGKLHTLDTFADVSVHFERGQLVVPTFVIDALKRESEADAAFERALAGPPRRRPHDPQQQDRLLDQSQTPSGAARALDRGTLNIR